MTENQPYYHQAVLTQLIEQYQRSPETFSDVAIEQMEHDANAYGIDFFRQVEDTEFNLLNTVKQAGAGFIEGFTTLKIGEEPSNAPERIARNLSHLAGFVGYIPKAPFAMLGKTHALTQAASKLRGKSIPMLVANKAQEVATPLASQLLKKGMEGKSGTLKTVSEFLETNIPSDMIEGAFHLGTASAVSSWQGGVDEMLMGAVGGAQAGAAFRLIGNLVHTAKIVPGATSPKLGAKFTDMTSEQQSERIIQGIAASLFMGLPATMQGATTPEQIYEYVLGGYFGVKEMPAQVRRRDRFIVKMFQDNKNPTKVPELTEGFGELSKQVQSMVKKESSRIWSEEGKILSKIAAQFMGTGTHVPPESAEIRVQDAPLPKTDRQTSILRAVEKGVEPTKEEWRKYSEEEKIYYSDVIDASPLEGWYSKYQLNEFNKKELQSIADRLDVKNYKDMTEEVLKANIMFNMPKNTMEVVSRLKLNFEEDDVFVESNDVGEFTSSGLPGSRLTQWVRRGMKKELEGLTPNEEHSKILDIARFISEKSLEHTSEEGPGLRKIINVDKLASDIQNEYKRALSAEAIGELRQLTMRANWADQIPHMSVRWKNTEQGLVPVVEFLATKGHPITAAGESKIQREPVKLWNDLWTRMTGSTESPYIVLDHVIEPGKRFYETFSLFRYKEKLNREGEITFNRFMFDIMKTMHKQKDPYFYNGGAGDKEKAFFWKYHPRMDVNKQMSKILTALGDTGGKHYRNSLDFYIKKYSDGQLSIKDINTSAKEMKEMHDKAFVSSYLWEMSKNYGDLPTKDAELFTLMRHQAKHSQIQDAKGYNKRAQIDMNSGYRGDGEYIYNLRDSNNNPLVSDFDRQTGYKFIIVPDAAKGFRKDSDKARKYVEATDGGALMRDDAIMAENMDAGMPEAHKQGQSKSFILSPDSKRGAMMGKYMFHSAGPELSAAMKKEGIHVIFPESAIKQHGDRVIKDYSFDYKNQTMKFDKKNIYDLPAENIYRVFSEKQDRHYIEPQLFPSQGLSNLVTGVLDGAIKDVEIRDMVDGLITDSFKGTTEGNASASALKRDSKNNVVLTDFFRRLNKDEVGVVELLDVLQTKGLEHVQDKVYNHLMRVNDRVIEELVRDGEIDHRDAEAAKRADRDFENLVDRLKIISEELSSEYKKAGIDYPVLITHMHKFTNPYRQTVLKNYIVHRASRPKVNNSISARMRPYDKSMQQTINMGKGLEENKFYLDEGFAQTKIYTHLVDTRGRGYIELGELWNQRNQMQIGKLQISKEFNDIFKGLGIRVPMDSMSGARPMEFGGFTGRKGYGVLLHPRVMRALGGADLDGDKAMIFFGGRSEDGLGGGLKQSWIDMYQRNINEFTRYIHKQRKGFPISKESYNRLSPLEKKNYEAYTMDNKNEPIPYGPDRGKTPRSILAHTEYKDFSPDFIKSKVGKYSPGLRAQMSEAASGGRMLLGSAVIAKKVIQGAHSSIMAMENQTYRTITDIFIPGIGNVQVETFLKANNDRRNTVVHRMMAQTGIALGSDPMDEIGLRGRDTFFNAMFNPILKMSTGRIWINGKHLGKGELYQVPNSSRALSRQAFKDTYLVGKGNEANTMKLKKGGIIKDFYEANNALFGRNWLEGRKHTYGEIKRKIGVLGSYSDKVSNNVLTRVSKLLSNVDWNDRILNRLDAKSTMRVYDNYYKNLEKFDFLKKLLGRSSFAVKPDSRLREVLNNELWLDSKQEWLSTSKKDFTRILTPIMGDKTFEMVHPRDGKISISFKDIAAENEISLRLVKQSLGLDKTRFKRKIIEDLVAMEEGMIIQDLTDMVSTNLIAKLASGLPKDVANADMEKANYIKMKYQHIGKENRKSENLKEQEGQEVLTRGDKISSEATAAEMDAEIRTYKFNMSGKKSEVETRRQLFDTFFLGSLHRGNKERAKAEIERLKADPNVKFTPEMESKIISQAETAETSLLKIGYGSRAIGKESLKTFIREMNILFNKQMDIPTPREIKEKQLQATNEEPVKIEGVKVDLLEEGDPFQGIRGLSNVKEKYNDLSPDGKKTYNELEGHLDYYHNSVGKHLREIVRGVIGKDLDAMNLQDWKNFNRFMKDLREPSSWDRMMAFFGKKEFVKGQPFIEKRFYHLFPEAINRVMMQHDFQKLIKKGAFLTKEGKWMSGKVAYPTHQVQKITDIWGNIGQQSSSITEGEINSWRASVSNLIEAIEEGTPLWRMMVSKRELLVAEWMKREVLSKETDKQERIKIGFQIKTYIDNYNKESKKARWNELKDKEFQFTYKDDAGKTISRRMTGQEALLEIDKKMTSQAAKMHTWLVGSKKYQERFFLKEKGKTLYHGDGTKQAGMERMDVKKFVNWVSEKIRKGEEIPMDLGQDVLRKLSREVMYQFESSPKLRDKITNWFISNTGKFPFESYFPHIAFDKKVVDAALKKEIARIMSIPDAEMSRTKKDKEIEKIKMRHKHLTGDWLFRDVEDWNYYDEASDALSRIGERSKEAAEKIKYFDWNQMTGPMHSRNVHLPGYSIEPRVIDTYIRNQTGTFHRQLGQILSRVSIENFKNQKKDTYGEELTDAWMNFFKLQIQNSSGYPAKIPEYMMENPLMNLKGTPFAWWADNNVRNKINNFLGKLGLTDKSLPKELRGLSLQDIKNLSNLEAKYEMAALLAHPKSMFANIYGGTSLTISSVGLNNWKNGRSIKWLKSHINPGKDKFGNEWNNLEDVGMYTTKLGIIPELVNYELGLNPNLKTANFRRFAGDVISKLKKDPEMSDVSLTRLAREHGISDTIFDKAAWFMRYSERKLRRDSYMAHMVQAWENFGGQLPYDHPVIVEMAKKGVKATQFMYNAPYRPMFAQTALGKVMTRFQLWSWNSVRFRNDVLRQAKIYGFQEGTPEFERFKRTAQIDLFMLGLSSVFAYSLFEAALPAPWNWFQDTADWIFGDEKTRDRAFFGSWPTAVAPLQMVTPPILRMAPPTFRAFIDQDFSKLTDYYIWTMFPFGRMARDVAGPQNIIENPIRSVEKLTGLPYLQFHKEMKENVDDKKIRPGGVFRW